MKKSLGKSYHILALSAAAIALVLSAFSINPASQRFRLGRIPAHSAESDALEPNRTSVFAAVDPDQKVESVSAADERKLTEILKPGVERLPEIQDLTD